MTETQTQIKASELRLGNYLIDCNGPSCIPVKVTPYLINHIAKNGSMFISGVDLTPEILEKAGFENKSRTTDYCFEYGNFMLGGSCRRLFPSVYGESGLEDYGNEINYVHQLQNLYFALTGEELQIEL